MENVTINYNQTHGGLFAFNVLGEFTLNDIRSKELRIVYNDSSYTKSFMSSGNQTIVKIYKFQLMAYQYATEKINLPTILDYLTGRGADWLYSTQHSPICSISAFENLANPAITFDLLQTSFDVLVKLKNSNFTDQRQYDGIISFTINTCLDSIQNIILIQKCYFKNNHYSNLISMSSLPCSTKRKLKEKTDIINISNCTFIENSCEYDLFSIIQIENINAFFGVSECLFQNNFMPILHSSAAILQDNSVAISKSHLFVSSSDSNFKLVKNVIYLSNTKLILKGPVIFHGYKTSNLLETNTLITFYNYIEFSNIKGKSLIHGTASYNIHLVNNVYINITNNHIKETIFSIMNEENVFYPLCFFQYYRRGLQNHGNVKQTILMESNKPGRIFDNVTENINCKWDPGSLYYGLNPLDVYKEQFQTAAHKYPPFNTGLLCYCPDEVEPNCYTNILKPVFPGQTLELYLALNPKVTEEDYAPISVKRYDEDFPHSVCEVSTLLEAEQLVEKGCTKLLYNIFSENQQQCKLILYSTEHKHPTVYYINLLNCPAGFSFDVIAKKCICDSKLKSEILSIDNCDINDQTILRPPNSWISATTHNNSYTYHISLNCPFHYCLPHSSHLNFSTPNSQCQFNRSGVLCGHCPQGLSTTFGSAHCQYCSNVYIFLIVVIAIAGVLLIFLMYTLNLTVVDGTINAFVFYVNIVGMNSSILFPKLDKVTPTYTFISLANLDLGVQTCFYNGMDDYAKMWLQLAFPFYLVFIATLIIITSRYSTTIQRLTARRALPVLATLFLLSYTKILCIVSSVLFFYSTITHLPSKHTTLVWSVDANVPLFGVRFTILFFVSLILFLILISLTFSLLFIKILQKLSMVTKFKSLLDIYQRPYKDRFYNWTGLQLLMRTVFFGISSLERNINLTICIILLSIIEGTQCVLKPFKNKALNYQELIFVLNVLWLYAYLLFSQDSSNIIVVNTMISLAAVNFIAIIIYHIITYVCGGMIVRKVWLRTGRLITCITDKCAS